MTTASPLSAAVSLWVGVDVSSEPVGSFVVSPFPPQAARRRAAEAATASRRGLKVIRAHYLGEPYLTSRLPMMFLMPKRPLHVLARTLLRIAEEATRSGRGRGRQSGSRTTPTGTVPTGTVPTHHVPTST